MGLTKMVVSLSLVVILFLSFYSSTAQPISSGTQAEADNNLIDTENGSQPIKDDTVRVDPLDHLRKYRGGYEIRDMHYWSSTVYTGVPGYALGVLWLLCGILYALYLLVNKFCFKSYDRRKLRKRSLYTRQYYLWPVLLALFFTILAIIGCGIVLGGDVKFHSRAKTVVDIIIDTADEASVTIFKTTDAMKFMSRNLDSAFGATDEAARFLNSTSVRLDSTATDIEREARKNRHLIDLGLKIVYIVTISIISLTLGAAIALLVFGILKLRRALYVFIVICWLLGVFCWLFFGLYFFIEKFAADTCTAFESFQRDPYNNTLSSILPCDELVSTQSVLKDVSAGVYNLVNQVTRALQGSLWEELQRRGDPQNAREFDVSEIETLFSAVVAKPNRDGKSDERKSASKTDTVHLIEHRRAYNTEIMLTKIKMPLPDMTAAALAMDESILDADQVENLIKFSPAKEEIELLKGYTGDKEKLGKCEQFFMELMRVPRVESKLRVFLFKIQYSSQVSDFRKSLNAVIVACEEVRNSYKLKEIMSKILFVGNTLNQGTARGSAVGFKLDSLLKLTDTRATNNKMTLMHYLCKVFSDKLPHLLDFHEDLVSLEAASKIQLKCLAEEMQSINKGLEKVRQELVASENDGPVSEVFVKTLKEFIGAAESEVTSVQNLYSVAGRNADSLAQYFNEEAARCPFEQVTTILLNFVRMFRKAHDENCKQDELKKKRKQKEVEMDRQRELI